MTKEQSKYWKQGFDAGVEEIRRQEGKAIMLGNAIIAVLDERYEFQKEDY